MNFGQAVSSCFSNYATFSGRATRSEYWYWFLFLYVGSICTTVGDFGIMLHKAIYIFEYMGHPYPLGVNLITKVGGEALTHINLITIVADDLIGRSREYLPLNLIFALATALPGIAVSVRRLHDVNKSGWWFLITFTGIGSILLLYWALLPSKDEENIY